METKLEIAKNWLPRYTGMPLEQFGEYILITNFKDYVTKFAERFSSEIYGEGKAMQASTNKDGLTIINYGIGSPNAATIMDLLVAVSPKGVLFLGKCGGLKTLLRLGISFYQLEQLEVTEPQMIIFLRKYQHYHRLNYINLCLILLLKKIATIELV
jgi:hypothetical protein